MVSIDAYRPPEIAARVTQIGQDKTQLEFWRMATLGVLAGGFIALGANFFTLVINDSAARFGFGVSQLFGGLAFSLGLVLVVVAGAELFTGNNLMTMAWVSRKITSRELLWNWLVVYFTNFLGAVLIAVFAVMAEQYLLNDGTVGGRALLIANAKVNLSFSAAFARGILCNLLVCLAVWLAIGARGVADKILAIIFPITAFVAAGFEHSVANMYFLSVGLFLKGKTAAASGAERLAGGPVDFSNLDLEGVVNNLVPVTIGNVIGGAVFVGIVYWFIYVRPVRRAPSPPEREAASARDPKE